MKASIFTTGSGTVDESADGEIRVDEYFQGLFTIIPSVAGKLREYGDVDIHVLSDEFGYVMGSDLVGESGPPSEDAAEKMRESLLEAVSKSDALLLMLTNPTYECVVFPVWDELVSKSREEIVWFVSASPSVLSELELGRLDGEVVVYERIGVTRISNESEEELLEVVDSRA